jgi:hypothetical protein
VVAKSTNHKTNTVELRSTVEPFAGAEADSGIEAAAAGYSFLKKVVSRCWKARVTDTHNRVRKEVEASTTPQ